MKAQQLFDVAGQVVAITGGASGIGLAYAQVMAANGAKVNLLDVDAAGLHEAVAGLNASGWEAHGQVADVTRLESLAAAFDSIVAGQGRLDTVFANAGISGGPGFLTATGERSANMFEDLSVELWERVLATNTTSVFLTLKAAIPIMKRQGGGRIIVTSSNSASKTETLVSAIYTTSKGAVGHLVRQAAVELAKYNILVNAISPGPVITNIAGGRLKAAQARAPFERAAPLGRICEPQDVQGAALFLASPAAGMITGSQIIIDGGASLGRAD